jgi:hypothetical protein
MDKTVVHHPQVKLGEVDEVEAVGGTRDETHGLMDVVEGVLGVTIITVDEAQTLVDHLGVLNITRIVDLHSRTTSCQSNTMPQARMRALDNRLHKRHNLLHSCMHLRTVVAARRNSNNTFQHACLLPWQRLPCSKPPQLHSTSITHHHHSMHRTRAYLRQHLTVGHHLNILLLQEVLAHHHPSILLVLHNTLTMEVAERMVGAFAILGCFASKVEVEEEGDHMAQHEFSSPKCTIFEKATV